MHNVWKTRAFFKVLPFHEGVILLLNVMEKTFFLNNEETLDAKRGP